MTESEWNRSIDPQAMLDFLRGTDITSDRKLRLFAILCCRKISHLLDTRCLTALDLAERFAEALAGERELDAAHDLATDAFDEFNDVREHAAEAVQSACERVPLHEGASHAAWSAIQLVYVGVPRPLMKATRRLTWRHECRWLRDLFGPLPFRPVPFDPAWRTRTAVFIARVIYEDCDFGLLPVLADALEDSGCENIDILNHCRRHGEHVRGCWVVDLLLEKQ